MRNWMIWMSRMNGYERMFECKLISMHVSLGLWMVICMKWEFEINLNVS
jgi:hypothetical protein